MVSVMVASSPREVCNGSAAVSTPRGVDMLAAEPNLARGARVPRTGSVLWFRLCAGLGERRAEAGDAALPGGGAHLLDHTGEPALLLGQPGDVLLECLAIGTGFGAIGLRFGP